MFPEELLSLSREVLAAARAGGVKIATAESCTGGLIAGLLTEIAGSSDVFDRGFVTYSNEAKEQMLDVSRDVLAEHGAVSQAVALAMAEGAIRNSVAEISIAVTGIAGPGGGSVEKPVGLVHVAAARKDAGAVHKEFCFGDIGRTAIRLATVKAALELLREEI